MKIIRKRTTFGLVLRKRKRMYVFSIHIQGALVDSEMRQELW